MDERTLDRLMRTIAERQHSLVAREQLRPLGASRPAVARRLRSPDWERVTDRVLRLVGSRRTDEQRAMAAVLDAGPGSVLSHAAAAALWDLPGFDLGVLHVSRSRTRSNRKSTASALHHPLVLPPSHCTTRLHVPVTTLARTVVDLAATEHEKRVERAANAAVRMGLTWSAIAQADGELPGRRPGSGVVRRLLALHGGRPPLGSGLEATVLRLLAGAGLPEPRRQVDLGGAAWAGRVDFFYEHAGLVIEVDGDWSHSTSLDVLDDRARAAALRAAGFRVLRLPEDLVHRSPAEVVRLVRAALAGAA